MGAIERGDGRGGALATGLDYLVRNPVAPIAKHNHVDDRPELEGVRTVMCKLHLRTPYSALSHLGTFDLDASIPLSFSPSDSDF